MSVAGPALAIIIVIVAVYVTPQWISRRQAIAQSREGDRFSSDLRMVNSLQQQSPAVSTDQVAAKSSVPLLTATVNQNEPRGVAMIESRPRRPRRTRESAAVRLDAQQARQLAALKSRRASRISAEAAAGQRRLITTAVALVALLAVGIAAAFSVFTAWWMLLPGFFFVGSLVASRLAGINSENARRSEESQLRELQGVRTEAAPRRDAPAAPAEVATPELPVVEVVAAETSAEVADEVIAPQKSSGWNVADLPAPSYARKGRVTGRQVHADTDIVSIAEVQRRVVGRPIAASGFAAVESDVAPTATFNLDLESILESRRAQ